MIRLKGDQQFCEHAEFMMFLICRLHSIALLQHEERATTANVFLPQSGGMCCATDV